MEQGLAQLKEIEGLDAISWWPLAVGWWVVIALLVCLIIGLLWILLRRRRFLRSWQYGILTQLDTLKKTLTPESSLSIAIELSELMRRIATFEYSREACAGLTGKDWLLWLKTHDPESFNWEAHASWLTDVAYAPNDTQLSTEEITAVINAIRRWVK
ncbi:MAG: hypothetical protein methR_P1209 [Methyloprofundus sp.]|nr:MAG: hypothetical protein methR_P1209 [Methyloprofundus sp.]